MYKDGENIFYYITVMNEAYAMPPMPSDPGVKDGILKGMYKYRASENRKSKLRAQLFGSGAILREVLKAQEILGEKYGVAADVWSVTSYKALYYDGINTERWNLLHPTEKPRVPYVSQSLSDAPGVLVAATDYLKALPNLVSKWVPRRFAVLGTDGFGRSDGREALRNFFEVDSRFITLATLYELLQDGKIESAMVQQAIKDLGIDTEKANPLTA
jgi:pyruvate dehydrogenase E1 component